MNNRFSFKRLLLLVQKQFSENVKLYLYGTLALLGLLAIVMFLWTQIGGNTYKEETLFNLYLIGLYIAGGVFANYSFGMLSNKDKGIYWLTLPASHGEKLVCAIFYNLIVFTIIYTLFYFVVSQGAVAYIKGLIKHDPFKYHYETINWNDDDINDEVTVFTYAFFAVQAFYLLGSVGIKRFSFVLTTAIGALLIIGFIFFMQYLSASFSKNSLSFNIINARSYSNEGNVYHEYSISRFASDTIIFLAKFIWAPFFWLVTWFKLKEKEI
ncbi:MAG: hypothetical protein PW786_00675 [Arachidicoccus sp.]|nr:hypothetical protein [Arachidicoccus sp.]